MVYTGLRSNCVSCRCVPAIGVALFLAALALPVTATAQDRPPSLTLPTVAFGIASAADWVSTYHALTRFHAREQNPILRPIDHKPGAMIGLGGAIDVGLAASWNYAVGRNHPRIAAAGLWAGAAFRAYLAIHNFRSERRFERR